MDYRNLKSRIASLEARIPSIEGMHAVEISSLGSRRGLADTPLSCRSPARRAPSRKAALYSAPSWKSGGSDHACFARFMFSM